MLGSVPLVDVHFHAGQSLKRAVREWAARFRVGSSIKHLYDDAGDLVPEGLDAYLEAEGVDVAILMPKYSPRVTGIHPVEDFLPALQWNPMRFRFVANVNPHLHYPIASELERQIELGAVGLKIHPVHQGFDPGDPDLLPRPTLFARIWASLSSSTRE